MADETTWKKIDDRAKTMKPLYDRMDESKDLAYMEEFKLRNFQDTYDLSNVINVTGNSPAVFGNAIVSDLLSAKWQTVVDGDISPRQAHVIEKFIEDNFEQADEMLLETYGIPSLYSFLANHVCIRSVIGVRWLSLITGDEYVVDCLPVDMRWTPYVLNRWVADITWKTKEDLEVEMEDLAKFAEQTEGTEFNKYNLISKDQFECRDYWDLKKNEVWINKHKLFAQPNTVEAPPFVIVTPASGFMLRDKNYLEHDSEDLFYLNRKLYKEMNRALSIEQTLGMDVLFPPYEQEQEDFGTHEADPVPKSGEVQPVRKGELHKPLQRGDLNRASLTARSDIYKQIELGGISDAELGSTALDRAGIWFAKQFEIRHKLEKARFEALAIMKEGLARMMIKQFLMSAESDHQLLIGKRGRKNKYSVSMLGDPDKYRISFKFMSSSKEMEIVNVAEAQAARGIVPLNRIVTDIMQAEDPAGWLSDLELEKQREANPAIGLAEAAVRYAEKAEDTEDEDEADLLKWQSMMLVHDYVQIMRQRMQPLPIEQASQKRTPEPANSNLQGLVALPSLLGGASSGVMGKQQNTAEETVTK